MTVDELIEASRNLPKADLIRLRDAASGRLTHIRTQESRWPPEDVERLVFLWTKTARPLRTIARDMERSTSQIAGKLNHLDLTGAKMFPRTDVCVAQLSPRQVQQCKA